MTDPTQPRHEPERQGSVLSLPPRPATVDHRPIGGDVVSLDRVDGSPANRGTDASRKALAVAFAFAHARQAGWRVRPICPHVADRDVPQHPEVQDLIEA